MKNKYLLSLFLLMLLFSIKALAQLVNITAIDTKALLDGTTLISVDLTEETKHRYFLLQNPERLVVDFDDAGSRLHPDKIYTGNTSVQQVRFGRPTPQVFRLVFDLKQPIQVKSDVWQALGYTGKRLVLQVTPKNHYTAEPPRSRTKAPVDIRPEEAKSVSYVSPKNSGRDVIVVIDAGHGGKDPGATGPNGTQEKDVVLAIAKELQRMISSQPGMKAVMTRDGNYYVTLRERLRKARKHKADIFVAIHADAFKNSHSTGASVYAVSLKGASSEAARWLAEKENYSELGDVNLGGKNDLLRSVLIDLSQTATISSSLDLGMNVLQEMATVGRLHHRKVEQAPFVVLKSPDIPSILVETGFLSNPYEEKKLRDPIYQRQVALAVMKGVRDYFYDKPPPGTWIAQNNSLKVKHYVVASGDSLTSIADKFNVSVGAIKRENQILGQNIQIGQKIKIPTSVG